MDQIEHQVFIKCSPFLTSATVGSGQPPAAHSSTASLEPSRTRNVASPVANVDDDDVADSDAGDANIAVDDVTSSPDFFFLLRPSDDVPV